MTKLNTPTTSSTSTTSTPPKLSFDEVAKSFTEKANAIVGKRKLAGPGSEYANVTITPAASHTHAHTHGPAKINPVTGLKMHRNNPQGVKCTNPICAPLPRADNHERDHCYWPGGGMEDKALAWICNRSKPKTETAAVATTTTSPTTPNEVTSPMMTLRRELSCASIAELPPSSPHLSALLDSGTTSHIINDRSHLVDFTPEDHPSVRMANQGELTTFGRGTCVADITIGNVEHRVVLRDCLYAPEAVFNLVSVSRMLQRGWDCVFKSASLPSGPCCKFTHKGQHLGCVPMIENLCQLDIRFIPLSRLSTTPLSGEITAFADRPLTWDMWHARMGHPGGDSVKRLPLVVTGIKVDKEVALQ